MEQTPRDSGSPESEARSPNEDPGSKPRRTWRSGRACFRFQLSAFGFQVLLLLLLTSCDSRPQTPTQRADAAKALFEQATKQFHIPSAEAKGAEQLKLQNQAAAAYQALLQQYPDQDYWAAQALRSLANIRAAQTNLDAAVKLYAAVEQKYPTQEWEVLMAWKSAADLLWDAGRREEASACYQKLVNRFDRPDAAPVVKTVVRGSKSRLAESAGGRAK
jgi:tetratricopeptide (TPR) repeat protein